MPITQTFFAHETMMQQDNDDLWRDFPKTATEFEARFATEEDCRAYWIKARWGGKPACARCKNTRVWTERDGFLFECADCGHQTYVGHAARENAQAAESVVPGGIRDQHAPHGHLGEGPAAHLGLRLL
jgi:Zn ribbon nucleic-acid-binding protein